MLIVQFFIFAVMVFSGPLSGSAAEPVQKTREVVVALGKTKVDRQSKIRVEFLEMLEDSRCPTGVNCIWAGNAKVKVRLSKKGETAKIVELDTMNIEKSIVFAGYEIKLAGVTPYPKSGVETKKSDYKLVLSISESTGRDGTHIMPSAASGT